MQTAIEHEPGLPGSARTSPLARIVRLAAAAFLAVAAASPAAAQDWPESNPTERDSVTGLLCLTPACDFVRLPGTDCICKKENPGEQVLARLKLTCSMSVGLRWQACPVKPPFGN